MIRLWLLLSLLIYYSTLAEEVNEVLRHPTEVEPERKKFIWNPFPGFCGPNATAVRCAGVCPETCAFKSRNCVGHCGVPCECRADYVFNESLLKCVLRTDCPADVNQQDVETHRVFQ